MNFKGLKFQEIQNQQDLLVEVEKTFIKCSVSVQRKAFFNWDNDSIHQELLKSRFFVASESDKIVSFIMFRENFDIFEILALGSDPDWVNRGIMTQLLNKFVEICGNQKKDIQLEVHCENLPAINLYKKCGFKMLRTRKNYYTDGADALVFAYFLLL